MRAAYHGPSARPNMPSTSAAASSTSSGIRNAAVGSLAKLAPLSLRRESLAKLGLSPLG
jgi:hypothetical protein